MPEKDERIRGTSQKRTELILISHNHYTFITRLSTIRLHSMFYKQARLFLLAPPAGGHALFKLAVTVAHEIEKKRVCIEINLVARRCYNIGDISSSINPTQLHETRVLLDSVTNE